MTIKFLWSNLEYKDPTTKDLDELQLRLKAIRIMYNITQTQFAKRVGVSRVTLNRLENWRSNMTKLQFNAIMHAIFLLEREHNEKIDI